MANQHVCSSSASGRLDRSTGMAVRLLGGAVYELNPLTGELYWVDLPAAMRLFGQTDPSALLTCEAFHRLLPEVVRARRERVLAMGPGEGDVTVPALKIEYVIRASDGRQCWFEERGAWLGGDHPTFVGAIRSIHDQKRRERMLTAAASIDDLTGLLPRERWCEAAETQVARASRSGGASVFVALAIDELSSINMRFGLDVGDRLVSTVAGRLDRAARAHDLVGRIAGNKFGVLLAPCDLDHVEGAVRRLQRKASEGVVTTPGGPVQVSVSVGAVSAREDAGLGSALLLQAEAALDSAKRKGPGQIHIMPAVRRAATERSEAASVAQDVLEALQSERLVLHYQPIVCAQARTPVRYECLARLDDGRGQVGSSASFIAAAEASGLIRYVDVQVLELAARSLGERPDLRLAVNVSGATVRQPDAADAYLCALEALGGGVTDRLTIELTETCAVDAQERVSEFVERVRAAGARFAIDDFGAGYTSFRYLKALRPDEVKIDGVYVDGVAKPDGDTSFIQALVQLAQALSMEVVAEWVGDDAEAALLAQLGVERLQGRAFGMAAPLPDAHGAED